MENRNEAEIYINGRRFKISGAESPEYMKKAADHINEVYSELKKIPGFSKKSHDYQTLMMYLNLTDRYLKAGGEDDGERARKEAEEAELISSLKMDLLSSRKLADEAAEKLSQAEKKLEDMESENGALKVKLTRMQDQDRVFAEKLAGLVKENDSYKTELSILRRKAAEVDKLSAKQETFEKEHEARLKELDIKYVRKIRELEAKMTEAEAEKAALGAKMADVEAEKAALGAKLADVEAERTALETKVVEAESKLTELLAKQAETAVDEDTVKKLEQRAIVAEQKVAFTEQIILTAEEKAAEAEQRASEAEKKTAEAEKKLAEAEQKASEAEKKAAEYEEQLIEQRAEYENKISSIRPGLEDLLSEQERESGKEYEELQKKYEALQGKFAKANEELDAAREHNDEMENDMIEYLDLIEEKEKEIAKLRYKLAEDQYEDN